MASLVLGWRMPYLLSCFNVTGQSMLVPNEIALSLHKAVPLSKSVVNDLQSS